MNTTMTRGDFCKVVDTVFTDEQLGKFLDLIQEGFVTENYRGFIQDETVYIVDIYEEELITWYKLGHIGRALKITKDDGDISYIEKVCKGLKEELNL